MKELNEKDLHYNELSNNLLKNISITGGLNNLAFIIFFLGKDIFLYNWLNKVNAANFVIYIGYLDAFIAFVLIKPAVLPKFYQEIDKKEMSSFNRTIFILLLFNFFIIFFSFLIILFLGFDFKVSKFTNISFYIILIAGVIILVLFKIYESSFYGLKKPKEIGLINLSVSFVYIIFLIIFRFLNVLNSFSAILLYIFSYFVGLILSNYYYLNYRSQIKIPKNVSRFDRRIGRKIIVFSYPLLVMSIFYFINFRAGTVILGSFNKTYAVYYYLSTNIIMIFIGLIGFPITNMAYSYIAEFYAKNNIEDIKGNYNFILELISIVEISCLILIYTSSPILIGILYSNYKSLIFIILFKIIIVAGIFYSLNQFLGKFPLASGKTKINLLAEALAGISNIIFLIISLQSSNLLYAGYGFLISTLIIFMIYVMFCNKQAILSKKGKILLKIIISSITSIIFYEIFYFITDIMWLGILLSILTYFILIIALNITSIKSMRSMMKTVFGVFKSINFRGKTQ